MQRTLLVFGVFAFFSSCSSVHYLVQAGRGQLALSNRARPIEDVIQDPHTPARIKVLLAEIPKIKKFGEAHGLKPTRNYTDYVQLDRPAAVYVVSACKPLEFKSKEWNFPVVGSFPYLGWFDLKDAKEFAQELKGQADWDVDVRGARAYSTLGWFKDSVLSSMIPPGDEALGELVNVVIHESVHATLYVKGQAYFDESLASFVAEKLTDVYLLQTRGADSRERKAYLEENEESEKIQEKFHFLYEKLDAVYHSSQSDTEKLAEKQKLISTIRDQLQFKREINNATLIQFKEYNVGEAEFSTLYRSCNEELSRFMGALKHVTEASFSRPQQDDLGPVVLPLARDGCKP